MAEIAYAPFGAKRAYRLVVRRVAPTPGSQLWLPGLEYSYYAFISDSEGELLEIEADGQRGGEHCQLARQRNLPP